MSTVSSTPSQLDVAHLRYQIYLKSTYRSASTQRRYSSHIKRLLAWLAERGVHRPKRVKPVLLVEWVADLAQSRAPATMKPIIAAARSFFRFCFDADLISRKKLRKILRALQLPKVPKNAQRTLSIDEIERLLSVCNLSTVKGVRDAAIISLLLDTGLRASEICGLRLDDVNFNVSIAPCVTVNQLTVTVKGGRRQYAYFGRRSAQFLRAWLRVRVPAAGVDNVFVSMVRSEPGRALDRHGLKVVLRNVGREAGIGGVSPHAFRRAFAVLLQMAGASTKVVQDLGRWENLETVLLYQRGYQAALSYNQFAPLDFISRQGAE